MAKIDDVLSIHDGYESAKDYIKCEGKLPDYFKVTKQTLYTDLLELIGRDIDPNVLVTRTVTDATGKKAYMKTITENWYNERIAEENQLRQELRTKLKDYMGIE